MQPIRSNSVSCETRRRLIEAAGEVFADVGFHNATIRQICEIAGANVAAVNYHFRDKAELYDAVLRYAHCAAEAEYAANRPPVGTCPSERLATNIRTFLFRILDEGRPAWHGKLISREMTEPSSALDQVITEAIRPRYQELQSIVSDLLGPQASLSQLEAATNSVVAQCVFYQHCKPVLQRMNPSRRYDKQGILELAEHITRFSLLAIEQLRKGASSGTEPVAHNNGLTPGAAEYAPSQVAPG